MHRNSTPKCGIRQSFNSQNLTIDIFVEGKLMQAYFILVKNKYYEEDLFLSLILILTRAL